MAKRVVIDGETMMRLLKTLQSDQTLKRLYKNEVLANVWVVADGGDLRIEDSGKMTTPEMEAEFQKALRDVLHAL